MGNFYDKVRWEAFRTEVIELDDNKCVRCHRRPMDGVILQVHHKRYLRGRMPWDYPYELCETLCKGCHAEEHGFIPPKTGWDYLGEEDLGDLSGKCEYCGTDIRYVFHINHPDWVPMEVGIICCDNLTGTEIASNEMESLRRFISRRSRFVCSSRWKQQDGRSKILQKGICVDIRPSLSGFRIHMNGHHGRKVYTTAQKAKHAAFEVLENGRAEGY